MIAIFLKKYAPALPEQQPDAGRSVCFVCLRQRFDRIHCAMFCLPAPDSLIFPLINAF
jgi:hypothetical protein